MARVEDVVTAIGENNTLVPRRPTFALLDQITGRKDSFHPHYHLTKRAHASQRSRVGNKYPGISASCSFVRLWFEPLIGLVTRLCRCQLYRPCARSIPVPESRSLPSRG